MTTIRPRTIRARRIEFDYPESGLARHFAAGDPVMSHVMAVLSALFPEGEDFFVRTVRRYRDEIHDPELKRQVGGFIGQEAIHGREHRAFNERLAAMGYPTLLIDRMTRRLFALASRVLPRPHQLAVTAALEHYTATLAEVLLRDPAAREMITEGEVRSLFLWHAVEESEHKAVAFDVFQTVSGRNRIRVAVMNIVSILFILDVVMSTALSLALDRTTYRHPIRLVRSLNRVRTSSPWLTRSVVDRIRDYNRGDFHPDDHDAAALVEHWHARLFGPEGPLSDRLPTP